MHTTRQYPNARVTRPRGRLGVSLHVRAFRTAHDLAIITRLALARFTSSAAPNSNPPTRERPNTHASNS